VTGGDQAVVVQEMNEGAGPLRPAEVPNEAWTAAAGCRIAQVGHPRVVQVCDGGFCRALWTVIDYGDIDPNLRLTEDAAEGLAQLDGTAR